MAYSSSPLHPTTIKNTYQTDDIMLPHSPNYSQPTHNHQLPIQALYKLLSMPRKSSPPSLFLAPLSPSTHTTASWREVSRLLSLCAHYCQLIPSR